MRSLALLLLGSVLAFAQTVSGIVTNSVTGAPVRKIPVMLVTAAGGPPSSATSVTKADGGFSFDGIPAGSYRALVHAPGWSTKGPKTGLLVSLEAGENKADLRILLTPLASVSGTVLDEGGEPVPNAQVQLFRIGFPRRKPKLMHSALASTDDRGQYRIFDVPPANYHLRATVNMFVRRMHGPSAPTAVYPPQFYGASDRAPQRPPVAIRGGEELEGYNFQMRAVTPAKLTGRILGLPEGLPLGSFPLALWPASDDEGEPSPMGGGTQFTPEGTFVMENIVPGSYRLTAFLANAGVVYRSLTPVAITPGGLQQFDAILAPGVDLAGTLSVEGGVGGEYQVALVAGDSLPYPGPPPSAKVGADGKFVLHGVVPGIWDINITPIPRGGYLKAMTLGKQDVLTEEMVITPQSKGPLTIVVSSRGARVEGTVKSEVPMRSAPVILLAPQGKAASVLSFYSATLTDGNGKFQMGSLAPGAYKLYAFEEIEPNAWFDPNFLKPFEANGVAVQLKEGEVATAEVSLLPEATPR